MKTCRRCNAVKPLAEFNRESSRADGLRGQCRPCDSEYRRVNRAHLTTQLRKYRGDNPALDSYYAMRDRARRLNLPCTLSLSDLPPIPLVCPILGIVLERGTGRPRDCSPSLDRLRPEQGYVLGNVAWISYRANRIKNDATLEELERVTRWTRESLSIQGSLS